jgi:carbamoyl-phosphate synthase small subunit
VQRLRPARLVLDDGTEYPGYSFGHEQSCAGEVVFNTGMTGYPQSLSDPSYRGQILVFTYPLLGNYGVPPDAFDEYGIHRSFESDRVQVTGVVVAEACAAPSHFAAARSLGQWLKEQRVPAICGIDTRSLTKRLRQEGVMNGTIAIEDDEPKRDTPATLVAAASMAGRRVYVSGPRRILVVDCGAKNNIFRCLLKRGATVVRVPWNHDLSREEYDGILPSNGPGDPKDCAATIAQLRPALSQDKPIFGICLGNQLLALAAGGDTYKLKFGHRSQNQPCYEKGTTRCHVTSQNHGYAVREDSLPADWAPWFVNANDGTNEGIRHTRRPFFSVQFHPEASPGPHDTEYLFDLFLEAVAASAARRKA